ncbi:phosphatidylinositol-glycan biosynthesis class F protein isoform X1 [Hyaena hyaena]|uniref:phosphatidylinositol-glycan biosynthesis class F protein isoform X1 n=1 Tax=Hyaena hyaena TaxID=95912 RepID=UPI00192239B5|nr:phosphatidylinositol-glycan biosynthesis class F protein isoform X1 [Hyaena hyaena]XP_039101849.1 phosphatidylinositol-glycan biosynthesis class F protein isoform X1 [Hyaena hyaena]XP_039101850.1 phosphatidylinositol-glycan biosynthesis class F protein isoform X1 [Hyaena hyaena]
MKDTDIKRLLYTHLLCIFSIILSIFIPSFFLENFSILETHLTWLCICSVFVTAVNLVLYLVVKPNASSKRSSLSYKVTRFLKCCIYFLMSCFFFHVIFVLYGAPLIELVLETFLFAVILSTFTTIPCLCLLGPNIKAWLRVFSRNGVTSIWENSLQITTISSFIGTWLGAFPIPLDWERPWQGCHVPVTVTWETYWPQGPLASRSAWFCFPALCFLHVQVWPISCTLGATFGYMAGLVISPLWIYWNRKQLTYKNN